MNDIFAKLRFLIPTLPHAEKIVAQYLLNNPDAVRSMTLALLAQEIGGSEASIIRLCKRLGYDGFSSMKQDFLIAMVDDNEIMTQQEILGDDTMQDIVKKVFQNNIQTLNDTMALVTENYNQALDALLKAKSVHFFGVGDAYAAGQLAYMKFSRLGLGGSAHSDVMLQLIAASSLTKGDVAFAISHSGCSRTIVQAMKVAKETGATTICITKMNKSPLLKYIDIVLYTATVDMTVGKDIISRRIADQAILDSLYVGVLTKSKGNLGSFIRSSQKAIDNNKM